eukprot:2235714-Pleurochrysis_carterae.AAC.4
MGCEGSDACAPGARSSQLPLGLAVGWTRCYPNPGAGVAGLPGPPSTPSARPIRPAPLPTVRGEKCL